MISTVLTSELAILIGHLPCTQSIYLARMDSAYRGWDRSGAVDLGAAPRYGVFSVVWLNVVSVAIQALLLAPALGTFQKPDFLSDSLRLAWKRLRPLLLGSAYYKTDVVLDRALSSLSRTARFSLCSTSVSRSTEPPTRSSAKRCAHQSFRS